MDISKELNHVWESLRHRARNTRWPGQPTEAEDLVLAEALTGLALLETYRPRHRSAPEATCPALSGSVCLCGAYVEGARIDAVQAGFAAAVAGLHAQSLGEKSA